MWSRAAPAPPHPGTHHPEKPGRRFLPSWAAPLRHRSRLVHDLVAVTPVVGTLVILAISAVGIAAVLTWGLPNIQQTQAVTELDAIYAQFETFDDVAHSVIRGGAIGKASEVTASIPKGQLQRIEDSLITITWYYNRTGHDERFFWFEGLADDTPSTFDIVAGADTAYAGHYIEVYRVLGTKSEKLDSSVLSPLGGFSAGDTVTVTLPTGGPSLYDRATRIVINHLNGLDDIPVMEAWLIPPGALVYTRDTSFGLAGVRLENNAVISEAETGDFMRTEPLGTYESDTDGAPLFAAIFTLQLIDNATYPGVQAAGAGSYPLLFALNNNALRSTGHVVAAFAVNAYGPHADLWIAKYEQSFGMSDPTEDPDGPGGPLLPIDTAGNGLILVAKQLGPTLYQGFGFAYMESLVEVTLKVDVRELGDGF